MMPAVTWKLSDWDSNDHRHRVCFPAQSLEALLDAYAPQYCPYRLEFTQDNVALLLRKDDPFLETLRSMDPMTPNFDLAQSHIQLNNTCMPDCNLVIKELYTNKKCAPGELLFSERPLVGFHRVFLADSCVDPSQLVYDPAFIRDRNRLLYPETHEAIMQKTVDEALTESERIFFKSLPVDYSDRKACQIPYLAIIATHSKKISFGNAPTKNFGPSSSYLYVTIRSNRFFRDRLLMVSDRPGGCSKCCPTLQSRVAPMQFSCLICKQRQ
jgi:hypothetical protein